MRGYPINVKNHLAVLMMAVLILFAGCSEGIRPVSNTTVGSPAPVSTSAGSPVVSSPTAPKPEVSSSPVPSTGYTTKKADPATLEKAVQQNVKKNKALYLADGNYYGKVIEVDGNGALVKVERRQSDGLAINYSTHLDWENLEKSFKTTPEPRDDASPTPTTSTEKVELTDDELRSLVEIDRNIDILPSIPPTDVKRPPIRRSPATPASSPVSRKPGPKKTTTPPPPVPRDYGADFYQLTGILDLGSSRTAMLRAGARTHSGKVGDTLPGEWRITSITRNSVTLTREGETRTLNIKRESR